MCQEIEIADLAKAALKNEVRGEKKIKEIEAEETSVKNVRRR